MAASAPPTTCAGKDRAPLPLGFLLACLIPGSSDSAVRFVSFWLLLMSSSRQLGRHDRRAVSSRRINACWFRIIARFCEE